MMSRSLAGMSRSPAVLFEIENLGESSIECSIEGESASGQFSFNIYFSDRKYKEKDWMRLKVQHYPLQKEENIIQTVEQHRNDTKTQKKG